MNSVLQRRVFFLCVCLYISSFVWITFDYLAVGNSVAMAIFGRKIRQSHIAASASVEIKNKGLWRVGTERETDGNRQNKKCPFDSLSKTRVPSSFFSILKQCIEFVFTGI